MIIRNGFSLVELIVALFLGALISIAATQLFLVNRQSENLQQGVAQVQDQGRFVLDYVGRDLMQAGKGTPDSVEPFLYFSGAVGAVPACVEVDFSCDGALYDQLVMQVNDGVDCQGNSGFSGRKRYRVNTESKGLICAYKPDGSDDYIAGGEIIDGVEAFQVLYGIDVDTMADVGYGQADYYTQSNGAKLALEASKRIVAARIGFLISSPMIVSTDAAAAPASIALLDKTYPADSAIPVTDGHLYRVFTATVSMRNLAEPN